MITQIFYCVHKSLCDIAYLLFRSRLARATKCNVNHLSRFINRNRSSNDEQQPQPPPRDYYRSDYWVTAGVAHGAKDDLKVLRIIEPPLRKDRGFFFSGASNTAKRERK